MQHLTWNEITTEAQNLADRHQGRSNAIDKVYGIPQGGAPVALLVAQMTGLRMTEHPQLGSTLIVDDLVDTGNTASKYVDAGYPFDALYRKPWSPTSLAPNATQVTDWLGFPWERDDGEPTDAVIRLLQHIGEDPTRDGLRDTPKRVVKALRELTEGYSKDPAEILSTTFDVSFDEMIVLTDVPYNSLCEHHMLPFTGTATLGYIPKVGGRVVGLSKLARLLDCFARRLQVQERMTNQIAQAIQDNLDPLGVGVVIRGNHSCMCARGIRKSGEMVTSSLLGQMRHDGTVRAEFLALAQPNRR
jgi:GTP cyclohydrolase I